MDRRQVIAGATVMAGAAAARAAAAADVHEQVGVEFIKNGYDPKLAAFLAEHQRALGTAEEAIAFALTIDDHYDMRAFLEGWQHGDLEIVQEFNPEYAEHRAKHA